VQSPWSRRRPWRARRSIVGANIPCPKLKHFAELSGTCSYIGRAGIGILLKSTADHVHDVWLSLPTRMSRNDFQSFLGVIGVSIVFKYMTRSSATTEKQRVSCACLPRLANWSCNAQNTIELQRLYYFLTLKRSDSRSTGQKRISTWNRHSRSLKVIHFAVVVNPTLIWRPRQEQSCKYSSTPYMSRKKLESLAYIFVW